MKRIQQNNIDKNLFPTNIQKLFKKIPKITFIEIDEYKKLYDRSQDNEYFAEYSTDSDTEIDYHDDKMLKTYIASYMQCKKCDCRTTFGFQESSEEEYPYIKTIMYYCKECCIYFVVCLCCKNLMRIAKNYVANDEDMMCVYRKKQYKFDIINESEDAYNCFVKYKHNKYWFDEIYGPITGPDGGYYIKFECEQCNFSYKFNDK